MTIRKRSTCQN
jgi:hypothetical protein